MTEKMIIQTVSHWFSVELLTNGFNNKPFPLQASHYIVEEDLISYIW